MYGMGAHLHFIFSILVNGFCFQHFFPYFQSFLSLFHIYHKYLPSAFSIFTTDGPSTSGLKAQSLELKFIYSEQATQIWKKNPNFIWHYLVSSNSFEISSYFCGLLSKYELGSVFVKNDKAAEFVLILKKIKCQLSWPFLFFWQKLDQTQWSYSQWCFFSGNRIHLDFYQRRNLS